MTITEWHGCYDGGWNGQIVPEAFAHPAKFANGLIRRIIEHGLSAGYWRPGDVLGDPFGGVALGGIIAGYYGLNWVGVELEPRFVALGNQNLDLHRAKWAALGYDVAVRLVQGDSRHFASLVGEIAGAVTSPPFVDCGANLGDVADTPGRRQEISSRSHARDAAYGQSPGQIGRLPAGKLDACVTSPPYEAANSGGGIAVTGTYPHPNGTPKSAGLSKTGGYRADMQGDSIGQIGNSTGETYWQAMRAVYEQVHLALKPGGVAAIVVKDYVSKGKRVPLCDDTLKLLVSLGFEPLERVRAMLVKESVENTLFEGEVTRTKERKSFFRRLAEKKGSPRIDWETVLFVRRL